VAESEQKLNLRAVSELSLLKTQKCVNLALALTQAAIIIDIAGFLVAVQSISAVVLSWLEFGLHLVPEVKYGVIRVHSNASSWNVNRP
jgi:hypothetical protein